MRSADGTDRLEYLTGTLHARFESRVPVGKGTSTASLRDLHFIEPQVLGAEWADAPSVTPGEHDDDALARGLREARIVATGTRAGELCTLEDVRLTQVRLLNVRKAGEHLVGDIEARVSAVRRVFVPAPVVPPIPRVASPVIESPPTSISPVREITPPRVPSLPRGDAIDWEGRWNRGCLPGIERVVAMLLFGAVILVGFWILSAMLSPIYDALTRVWDRAGIGSIPPSAFPEPVAGVVRRWSGTMHPVGQVLLIGVLGYVVYALWRVVRKKD